MMDSEKAARGLVGIWKRNSYFTRTPNVNYIKPGYWVFVSIHILYKNLPIVIASGAFLVALSK